MGSKTKVVAKPASDSSNQDLNTVQSAIQQYLNDIAALEFSYPLAIGALDASFKSFSEGFATNLAAETKPAELRRFVREFNKLLETVRESKESGVNQKKGARPKSVRIPLHKEDGQTVENLLGITKVTAANELISRSFVVTLVSQFDAYIAALVQALYHLRPDILNLHSKSISYSDLIELGGVEAVERRLIENEVESLLRSSHSDQFKWLETKFDIKLRESEANWAGFIELTERRNLFVHANARVSSQYLSVCTANKIPLPDSCKIGSQLQVTEKYMEAAYSLLAEIGIKLGLILWRKAAPEEQTKADNYLIHIAHGLIKSEKYGLAKSILEAFLFSIPKGNRTESASRTIVINLAQCFKWLGQQNECSALLQRYDWSASAPVYSVGVAVLKDDFSEARRLMKLALDAGELMRRDVETWPLFKEFRASAEYEKLATDLKPVATISSQKNTHRVRARPTSK